MWMNVLFVLMDIIRYCVNIGGSYLCFCFTGYHLMNNQKTKKCLPLSLSLMYIHVSGIWQQSLCRNDLDCLLKCIIQQKTMNISLKTNQSFQFFAIFPSNPFITTRLRQNLQYHRQSYVEFLHLFSLLLSLLYTLQTFNKHKHFGQ